MPAAIGILVILLFGAAPAFAASPAGHASPGSPPGLAGRQVGNSPTWHLTDGAMVHVHKTRNAPSSHAPIPPYQGTPPVLYWGGPIVPSEHVVSIYWAASTIYAGGPTPGTTGVAGGDGSLVGYFLSHLGGSNYYNTNTTYYDTVGGGHTVANTLSYTGFWADNASPPSGSTNVSDASVMNEIISGFNSGKITYDASTVYAVFSSGSVNLGGGFGTQYCAYHGDFSWNGHIVLYAVMPYNYAAGFSCFTGNAPNGDAPADAEVNTLAHELEEANTDPQLNAWFDSPDGYEDADECAWIFGNAGLSGGQANITVGAKNFYVQEQWLQVPNGGQCVQGYAPGAPTAPAAPTLNSATAGVNSVSLSWSAGSNGGASITNFSIYRSTTPGAEGTTAYATVGNVTGYTDNGASAGVTYYYTVAATNSVGTGPQSNERSATPNAPPTVPGAPTLNSATGGTNSVVLSWSAPASNGGASITGYAVYRSTTAGGEGTTAFATVGNVTTYTDSSASVGTTYYYNVAATNSVGTGAQSGERSGTPTAATVPGASTLTASKATGRNKGVQLSWTAAAPNGSAISGYSVYRSTSSSGAFTVIKTVSASTLTYRDAGTTSGQRYYYYVLATNVVGDGPHSNTASAIAR